jgi:hypothetical protein
MTRITYHKYNKIVTIPVTPQKYSSISLPRYKKHVGKTVLALKSLSLPCLAAADARLLEDPRLLWQ